MPTLISQFEAACAARLRTANDRAESTMLPREQSLQLAEEIKRLALDDVQRALAVSERLVEEPSDDAGVLVQWLAARAHVLCYANRFDEAVVALDRATTLARSHGADRDIGQVSLASVQPLARLGRLEEADLASKSALAAYKACHDHIAQGKAALNRGIVLRMRGRLDDALASFALASELVGADLFLQAALASNRAEVLLDLDRFAEAEQAFGAARESFVAGGHTHAAAIVEGNRADLLSREGRIDDAMESFERAKMLFATAGAKADGARLEAEQAEALAAIGAHEDAIRMYAAALPRLEADQLKREVARSRMGLGLSLRALGAWTESQRALQQALTELDEVGSGDLAGECQLALGQMALGSGNSAQADANMRSAFARLADRPVRLARAHAECGEAFLEHGLIAEATRHADTGQVLAASVALLPLRARFSRLQGRLLLRNGHTATGAAALASAMRDADEMRGSLRVESLRLACGESWRDLYMETCVAALDTDATGGLALAFEALDRLRSRTLLDALGSLHITPATNGNAIPQLQALHEQLDHIVDELNILYNRIGLGRAEDNAQLQRLETLEHQATSLRQRLAALGSVSTRVSEPLALDEALSQIPSGTAVLLLWPDGDAISAMILRRGSACVRRRFASIASVQSLLRKQRFSLDRLHQGQADQSALANWFALCARMSDELLGPLAQDVNDVHRLAISTFGLLEDVPWSLLAGDEAPLGAERVLLHVPGVSTGLRINARQQSAGASENVLAVGVADALAPMMEHEAREVAATSHRSTLLVGQAATAAAVLDALAEADRVHLALHCVYSQHHPLSSRVRCSDRWVTARELAKAIRPGAVVVLAGCESGRMGGPATEDRHGLIRAMLGAGASSVLASHWPLHDKASLTCMTAFHHAMATTSGDAAAALRIVRSNFNEDQIPSWLHGGIFVTGGFGS